MIILFVISCVMCARTKNLVKCGWKGTGWYMLVSSLLSIGAGSPEQAGGMIALALFFTVPMCIWVPVGIHALIRWGQAGQAQENAPGNSEFARTFGCRGRRS